MSTNKLKADMIRAIEFVKKAQCKKGAVYKQFCKMEDGRVSMTNGVVTMSAPFPTDLSACVHRDQMVAGLRKLNSSHFNLIAASKEVTQITQDDYSSNIPSMGEIDFPEYADTPMPCADPHTLYHILRETCYIWMRTDYPSDVSLCSIYLDKGLLNICSPHTNVQVWVGDFVDPSISAIIPRQFIVALRSVKKTIKCVNLAISENGAHAIFEDDNKISTSCYTSGWPDPDEITQHLSKYMTEAYNTVKCDDVYRASIENMVLLSKDSNIYFNDKTVKVMSSGGDSSTECTLSEGVGRGFFPVKELQLLYKRMTCYHIGKTMIGGSDYYLLSFYGDRMRGMTMQLCEDTPDDESDLFR